MEQVLSVAFIVAVVAFFKAQFGWEQSKALLAAFGVALVVGLAPQVAALVPAAQPWVQAVINVVTLFLAAAGSWDALKSLTGK